MIYVTTTEYGESQILGEDLPGFTSYSIRSDILKDSYIILTTEHFFNSSIQSFTVTDTSINELNLMFEKAKEIYKEKIK